MRPIVVSCGEPGGISGEIALKAHHTLKSSLPFFILGDVDFLSEQARHLNLPIAPISHPEDTAKASAKGLPVLHHAMPARPVLGQGNPRNAPAVGRAIERGVALCEDELCAGICTLPIHKELMQNAGFPFAGHTEFLAHLGGVERTFMMLAAPELRVVPVTTHIALRDVATHLTADLIKQTIIATDAVLRRDFAIANPRIAIAGLNPHAGENGRMGDEEITLLRPVMDELTAQNYHLTGPHPADSLFHQTARANYDAVVCMYHDQALIPLKTLNFAEGVNITFTLPFLRTSPDHGTAFDIAPDYRADPSSFIAALKMLQTMARNREKHHDG